MDAENEEPMLICAICQGEKTDKKPRVLQCLHSFCEECLQRYLREKGDGTSLSCPVCLQDTLLPSGGIAALELDPYVELIKKRKQALQDPSKCEACPLDRDPRNAMFRCVVCSRRLCKDCREYHDKRPGYGGHFVHPIIKECLVHGAPFTHICQTCFRGICFDCIMKDDHREHLVEPIARCIGKVRAVISAENDELKSALEELLKFIADLQKDHHEAVEAANQLLREGGHHLKQRVDDQMAAVRKSHHNLHSRKLQMEQGRIGKICQQVGSTLSDLEAFLQGDSLEFVVRLPDMKKRLDQSLTAIKGATAMYLQNPLLTEYTCDASEYPHILKIADQIQFTCKIGKSLNYPNVYANRLVKVLELKYVDGRTFKQPREIAVVQDGSVLVADRELPFLSRFDTKGNLVAKYYFEGTEGLNSVSVERDKIYAIPSRGNCIIEMFPSHILRKIEIPQVKATGLAADPHDLLVVVQGLPGKILRYNLKDSIFSHQGTRIQPSGMAKAIFRKGKHLFCLSNEKTGKVYIQDGEGKGQCDINGGKEPLGVALLQNDNILIADRKGNSVTEYNFSGKLVRRHLEIESPCGLAYCHPFLWVSQCADGYYRNDVKNCGITLFRYK